MTHARRGLPLLGLTTLLALSACGGDPPPPEPVLMSQFKQGSDRFDVVSAVGKSEGTITRNGRACDIYRIYTSGLTSGGRAALKAGEVLTSVATLGLAQIIWAPVKAGTRPQLHTVLFCFADSGKLVDIYDKDPTDSGAPDHIVIDPTLYATPVVITPVIVAPPPPPAAGQVRLSSPSQLPGQAAAIVVATPATPASLPVITSPIPAHTLPADPTAPTPDSTPDAATDSLNNRSATDAQTANAPVNAYYGAQKPASAPGTPPNTRPETPPD